MHWCKMKIHGYLLDFYRLYIYNNTKICNIFTPFYCLYFCEYMNVEMLFLLHVVDFYRERVIYLIFYLKVFSAIYLILLIPSFSHLIAFLSTKEIRYYGFVDNYSPS